MRVINRVFNAAAELAALGEKIDGVTKELTAIGGSTVCESYFYESDGTTPRNDIGQTWAQFQNAAFALDEAKQTIATYQTNLYTPNQ